MMFRLHQPSGGRFPNRAAGGDFSAQFGGSAQLQARIGGEQIGAGNPILTGALIADRAGSDAQRAVRQCHISAQACVPFASPGQAVDLIIDHNELRVEFRIAAQHGLCEGDRA